MTGDERSSAGTREEHPTETIAIDRSPARVSARVALACGAVCSLSVGLWYWPAGAVALLGLGCLAAGLYRRSTVSVGVALCWFILAAVAAGVAGVPAEPVLVAAVAGVVAWDAAERAITLGEQLGRDASTARVEIVHAASSGFVGVCTVGIGYLLATGLSVSYSLPSVLLLCGGAVLLLYARRADR